MGQAPPTRGTRMNVWLLWILAAVIVRHHQVMSVSFVIFLMFAIGALAAGDVPLSVLTSFVQVIVFAGVTPGPLLALLRPFTQGRIDRSGGYVRTNTDALIRKTACTATGPCEAITVAFNFRAVERAQRRRS